MVYGRYITDTVGKKHFFVEGCSYCRMSTGGGHEANCPCKDLKVTDKPQGISNLHLEVWWLRKTA